jgi:hypothetical protein
VLLTLAGIVVVIAVEMLSKKMQPADRRP